MAYIRHLLKKIDTQTSSGSSPVGGQVDVATTNYEGALLQQWISLEIGSSAATAINLLSSIIEPFNLYASTLFYQGLLIQNALAFDDNLAALVTPGTSSYLPGIITPAHLRLSCHFQGSGNIPAGTGTHDKVTLVNAFWANPASHTYRYLFEIRF